jgi:hypothetical protein
VKISDILSIVINYEQINSHKIKGQNPVCKVEKFKYLFKRIICGFIFLFLKMISDNIALKSITEFNQFEKKLYLNENNFLSILLFEFKLTLINTILLIFKHQTILQFLNFS